MRPSRGMILAAMGASLMSFLPGIAFTQAERAVMPTETRQRRPANAPRKRRTGWFYDPKDREHGKQERARRMRQIAAGQLKAENGLVL